MPKPSWSIGTIVQGTYFIGFMERRLYFRVVGHSEKKMVPRLEQVEAQIRRTRRNDFFIETSICLEEPVRAEFSADVYPARWCKKERSWTINRGKKYPVVYLDDYKPGETFTETFYY